MTDALQRVRAITRLLPEAEERSGDGHASFLVAGETFVTFEDGPVLRLRADDGAEGWTAVALDGDADWAAIEDAIARSWELVAPAGLLEAGGR